MSSEKDSHLKIDTHEDKPHYNTGKSLYYCKLRNTKDFLPTTRSRRRPGRIARQARGGAGPCDSFNLDALLAERLRQHICCFKSPRVQCLLDGAVVEPTCQRRGHSFNPWFGKLLSPCTTTTDPVLQSPGAATTELTCHNC